MKIPSPSFATLAAISYAIFAAFGIAVWYTLLFVAVPIGATTTSTLQQLLQFQPEGHHLEVHAAATIVAVIFAGFLLLAPPSRAPTYLGTAITGVILAALAWRLFAPDIAVLPTVSAAVLAWGWVKAPPGQPTDA